MSQVTRNQIHQQIIHVLKIRDIRSEDMWRALGINKDQAARRKAIRERKQMVQHGDIFKVGKFYTLKKPEKAHMKNLKTFEFIDELEGCKYSEREALVDNINFSASILVKSEATNKRLVNQEAERFLKHMIGHCIKGLRAIDAEPYKMAYIVCVTNQN